MALGEHEQYVPDQDSIDALGESVNDNDIILDNAGNPVGTAGQLSPAGQESAQPSSLAAELEARDAETDPVALAAKFEGKSKEDIARSYYELEKKYGEVNRNLGVSKKFLRSIEHFFRPDENGAPQVNDDMVYLYGAKRGWFNNPNQNEGASSSPPREGQRNEMTGDNSFLERFEENPESAIEDKIARTVEAALNKGLEPLRRSVVEDRYETWTGWMRNKHKDYDKYEKSMHMIADKFKIPLDNKQTFEDVYHWAKATSGGYVDKETALSELDALRKSRSVMKPTQNFPQIDEANATTEQLIGGIAPMDSGDAKIMRGLFGKGFLTPD